MYVHGNLVQGRWLIDHYDTPMRFSWTNCDSGYINVKPGEADPEGIPHYTSDSAPSWTKDIAPARPPAACVARDASATMKALFDNVMVNP